MQFCRIGTGQGCERGLVVSWDQPVDNRSTTFHSKLELILSKQLCLLLLLSPTSNCMMRHDEVFVAWQKLIWHRYYLGTASVNHLLEEVGVYPSIRNELPKSFACLVTNIGQAYMVDLLYVIDLLWFADCNLTVACPSGWDVLIWSKCRRY